MPDVIILSKDKALTERLTALCCECSLRVKCTETFEVAKEWLGSKAFDALLVDPAFAMAQLETLSVKLWEKNPLGAFVVTAINITNAEEISQKRWEWSLLGASFVEGGRGIEELRNILVKIASCKVKQGRQFKVMVVEDLDSPRDIICSFVEHIGYPAVQGVASAKEALQLLEATPGKFSCIVTDINMPQMSGKALIEAVRQNKNLSHIPIIVLTAYGTVDNLLECMNVGASGFLVKPPTKAELNRELNRAMRIVEENQNPRLTSQSDVENLRDLLIKKGFQ